MLLSLYFFVFITRFNRYFKSRAQPFREIFHPAQASYMPDNQTNTFVAKG